MGLKEVKSKVLEDAREKADQLEKEAEQRKKEIVSEAEEEAEQIRSEYQDKLEEEKESYERKAVSNANMKAKQEKLQAKQEKLDEVFENFREQLTELSKSDKKEYVERCRDKADFEPGKIIGGKEFEKLVDKDFEKKDVEGVILVSEDGEKRQDFTFEKILQRFKDQYRQEVAERLFE